MSSLADPASARPARSRRTVTVPVPRVAGDGVLATGVALGVAAASFAAAGGLRLERTTYVLIAMMLGGALLAAAALIVRPRSEQAKLYGGLPLLTLGLLAAAALASAAPLVRRRGLPAVAGLGSLIRRRVLPGGTR